MKHHRDFLADQFELLFVVVGDVLAGNDDASGVGLEEAHDVMQGDGLAHAAASENADRFRGHNIEVDVIENDIVAEGLRDVAEFDVGREFGAASDMSALAAAGY